MAEISKYFFQKDNEIFWKQLKKGFLQIITKANSGLIEKFKTMNFYISHIANHSLYNLQDISTLWILKDYYYSFRRMIPRLLSNLCSSIAKIFFYKLVTNTTSSVGQLSWNLVTLLVKNTIHAYKVKLEIGSPKHLQIQLKKALTLCSLVICLHICI